MYWQVRICSLSGDVIHSAHVTVALFRRSSTSNGTAVLSSKAKLFTSDVILPRCA